MPKWNKDAKEFAVSVHYNNEKGSQIRIPKPLLEKMGNPKKVTFVVNGDNVKLIPTELDQAKELLHRKRRNNS